MLRLPWCFLLAVMHQTFLCPGLEPAALCCSTDSIIVCGSRTGLVSCSVRCLAGGRRKSAALPQVRGAVLPPKLNKRSKEYHYYTLLSFFRPISEDEIKHLKDQRYGAISDEQIRIDQKLQAEVRRAPFSVGLPAPIISFSVYDLISAYF